MNFGIPITCQHEVFQSLGFTYPWLGKRDFEVEVQVTTSEHLLQRLKLAHLLWEVPPWLRRLVNTPAGSERGRKDIPGFTTSVVVKRVSEAHLKKV